MRDLRLDTNFVDYAFLAVYFGVGFLAKRDIHSTLGRGRGAGAARTQLT